MPDFDKVLSRAWNEQHSGSPMFQVCEKIKSCRVAMLKLRGTSIMNSAQTIQDIKAKMELLQEDGGSRNWQTWKKL